MDLSYGEEYEVFRQEVRGFLKGWPLTGSETELPAAAQEKLFRRRGIERGYVYRDYPVEYGGSGQPHDALKDRVLQEEYFAAGAPGSVMNQGPGLLVPTLLEYGSEAQKREFIPPTLAGDMLWCQGYSEPGSGSDLASLQSSAVLDGDQWVVNGQKIWTSAAVEADYMFGLFRTEPEASKHGGISYLLIDMQTSGIDVRPLRQITGGTEFNEVFFDDVRIPAGNILGSRGEGWAISRSTLKHERNLIGNPRLMRQQFALLLDLARETLRGGRPALEDPVVRDRIAEVETYLQCVETTNLRMLSASVRGEEQKAMLPMLMIKLYSTDVMQRITRAAYDLLEGRGLVEPHEAHHGIYSTTGTPSGAVHNYLFSLGPAIAGGASNIQRNIIGERGLGLPRDLRPGG